MPKAPSSTRRLLSSFTARVLPSDVTASPGTLTPAARNAATESAFPQARITSADGSYQCYLQGLTLITLMSTCRKAPPCDLPGLRGAQG